MHDPPYQQPDQYSKAKTSTRESSILELPCMETCLFEDSNTALPHGFHLPCMHLSPWPSDSIAFTSSFYVSVILTFIVAKLVLALGMSLVRATSSHGSIWHASRDPTPRKRIDCRQIIEAPGISIFGAKILDRATQLDKRRFERET